MVTETLDLDFLLETHDLLFWEDVFLPEELKLFKKIDNAAENFFFKNKTQKTVSFELLKKEDSVSYWLIKYKDYLFIAEHALEEVSNVHMTEKELMQTYIIYQLTDKKEKEERESLSFWKYGSC